MARRPLRASAGLCVEYGPVAALRDVSLQVGAGEAVALIGANGAGKSTLFKSIIGFLRPRGGRAPLGTTDIAGVQPRSVASGSAWATAPEGRRVFPGLTVRENLEVAAARASGERERGSARLRAVPALWRSASARWAGNCPAASSRCSRSRAR